jgi:hypothetical protein
MALLLLHMMNKFTTVDVSIFLQMSQRPGVVCQLTDGTENDEAGKEVKKASNCTALAYHIDIL